MTILCVENGKCMGAFSMLRKFPEKTRAFLEKGYVDDLLHNKAIQKSENLTESVRKKEQLTCLKR